MGEINWRAKAEEFIGDAERYKRERDDFAVAANRLRDEILALRIEALKGHQPYDTTLGERHSESDCALCRKCQEIWQLVHTGGT